MGRHLLKLAPAVGIAVVMAFCGASASGEALATYEPGVSMALKTEGSRSGIEVLWLPDEPGDESSCGEPEADRVISAKLVHGSGIRLGVALNLGLCHAEIGVGFGDMRSTHGGSQSLPGGGAVPVGWIEIGELPATVYSGCERGDTE